MMHICIRPKHTGTVNNFSCGTACLSALLLQKMQKCFIVCKMLHFYSGTTHFNPKCLIMYGFLLKPPKQFIYIYIYENKQLHKGFFSCTLMKFIPSWDIGQWLKIHV